MEIWRLLAVIITVSVIACSAQGMSFTLDKEHWISKNREVCTALRTQISLTLLSLVVSTYRFIKKPFIHHTVFLIYNDKDRHFVLIIKATNRAANKCWKKSLKSCIFFSNNKKSECKYL